MELKKPTTFAEQVELLKSKNTCGDSEKWNHEFLKPFIKLINTYKPYISQKHLDFPYRWKSMLKK